MSQTVTAGQSYETGESYTRIANHTGLTYHVCDCCQNRVRFTTLDAVERHEDANTPARVSYDY